MHPLTALITLFSVLVPSKMWYAPSQPILVSAKTDQAITLVLTDFAGKPQEAKVAADVEAGKEVDIKAIFPAVSSPGTYVLFAVPRGKTSPADFVGTPLVISVRADSRPNAPPGPEVVRVTPLTYATMSTDHGDMTLIFWSDVAPNTVDSFIALAAQGYFDGLTFHRIVPGFVVQGGDPRGDGMGGPGYNIPGEFNSRKHEAGVLSMARNGDPIERSGMPPRPEFRDSAGSQFFICLDYTRTKALDGKYTAFGKVVSGEEVYKKLGAVAVGENDRPTAVQTIKSVSVSAVTPQNNPYAETFGLKPAAK